MIGLFRGLLGFLRGFVGIFCVSGLGRVVLGGAFEGSGLNWEKGPRA